MADISVTQARGIFTQSLVAIYKERKKPTNFLRSFFTTKESNSKYVSIEVQRGTDKIAVDVLRGTGGNRNQFARSTEKIFQPPLYSEYFDATELEFYDNLMNSSADSLVSAAEFRNWLDSVSEKIALLQDKIERSYERQCAEVFTTGIVTINAGTDIDYKRKAASKVTLATTARWSQATSTPIDDLKTGIKFLRTTGKAGGGVFNVIAGDAAMGYLTTHADFIEKADLRNGDGTTLMTPQANADAFLIGRITVGSYVCNLWSYPETYDLDGTDTPYIADNDVVILPTTPKFVLSFAGIPQLVKLPKGNPMQRAFKNKKGAYLVGEYIDEMATVHKFDIKSAGIAIPVGVDQIYTLTVA